MKKLILILIFYLITAIGFCQEKKDSNYYKIKITDFGGANEKREYIYVIGKDTVRKEFKTISEIKVIQKDSIVQYCKHGKYTTTKEMNTCSVCGIQWGVKEKIPLYSYQVWRDKKLIWVHTGILEPIIIKDPIIKEPIGK